MPTCKCHQDIPALIYSDCVGCELDRLNAEIKRLRVILLTKGCDDYFCDEYNRTCRACPVYTKEMR